MHIIRSRRRTIALEITPSATLVIRAPLRAPLYFIEKFVKEKNDWIKRKIEEVSARPKPSLKQFVDGEEFLYLGEIYKLKIVEEFFRGFVPAAGTNPNEIFNFSGISLCETNIIFPKNLLPNAAEEFEKWYKKQACLKIPTRVAKFAQIMGLKYKVVKITRAKKQWGSCGRQGALNFAFRLIMAPLPIIDYVVVHELAHIKHKGHGARFWNMVKTIMPDYKIRKQWLKNNGQMLICEAGERNVLPKARHFRAKEQTQGKYLEIGRAHV